MSRISVRAYEELRRMLLTGELGFSDYLAEERLARMLGCSRTPIREAFLRLETEQFLERDRSGHFRPRPPQIDRMRDLYAVRSALEQLSVRTAQDRSALEMLLEEWDGIVADDADHDFVYLDEGFHVAIAAATQNQVLLEMLRQVNDKIRIIRLHDFLIPGRVATTIAQHRAILRKLLDGDVETASKLMGEHIAESAGHVEQAIMRLLTHVYAASAGA